jgi:hypothetical protein
MTLNLRDNPEQRRFELIADGQLVGIVEYEAEGNTLELVHTEVLPGNEGKGYGSALAKQTLELVRAQGKRIVPLCEFIVAYLGKHPEYNDLVEHKV